MIVILSKTTESSFLLSFPDHINLFEQEYLFYDLRYYYCDPYHDSSIARFVRGEVEKAVKKVKLEVLPKLSDENISITKIFIDKELSEEMKKVFVDGNTNTKEMTLWEKIEMISFQRGVTLEILSKVEEKIDANALS